MTRNVSRRARALMAALLLLGSTLSAHAQTIVQDYYVPMPEAQIRTSFLTLAPATGTTMDSVISVVVAVAGTKVVYDHWEDGYEIDINNPVQSTTKIWGDGINANGIAPGFVNDPASLAYGTVLVLRNNVALPRNPATILYDGRDHVGATRGIVMSRSAWATSPGSVLADATEVQSTIDWGTNYVIPIGQNVIIPTPSTSSMFELTSLMVMAATNNTAVQIDTDGNGTVDITTTLNQGESYQVTSGVNAGATVTSTKPVQVQVLTGDIGANYESRWYTIPSTDQWTSEYYSPVGTASNGESTYIFLRNANASAITINYTTQTGSGSFPIPANSTYTFLAPQSSGTKFVSAGGQDFYGVAAVGASLTSNNVHDWGFDLVPSQNLTTEAVVGWGPGTTDLSSNGSPVWVTATGATTIYVDYNGDHLGALTDPQGGKYDVALSVSALQVSRVFEPDKDQTGERLYTLDGTLITAAWGQDPATAGPGNPYLDAGTTIPNFPVPVITKSSAIFNDTAPLGSLNIGDTLLYTVTINNQGLVAIGNTVVLDPLPASLTYVINSTTHDSVPVADSGTTPFPLDESGYVVPIIPRRGTTSFSYKATINASGSIANTAQAAGGTSTVITTVPPGSTAQCVIDFTGSSGTTITSASIGSSLYVTLTDSDANTNTGTAQSLTVSVTDTTSGDIETITLVETGVNTGVFRNTSGLATSATAGLTPNDGTLHMVNADTLSVTYTDPLFHDTCSDSVAAATAALSKILYLSTDGADNDPTGALDRIDPVATSDATTSSTSTLAAPSAGSITVSGAATKGRTGGTATGTSEPSSPATTITFSHSTGSGTNTLLLVGVSLECSGSSCSTSENPAIDTVTFNGVDLNHLGSSWADTRDASAEIWYMFNPPASTTANVVVTQAATTVSMDMVAGAVTFAGVNTGQTLTYVPATASGASGAATAGTPFGITIPSATGNLVFDVLSLDNPGTLSALIAPRTLLWNHSMTGGSGNSSIQGAASYNNGAASVTENWTTTVASSYALGGVSIAPGAGGSGGSATFTQSPTFCENFTLTGAISAQTYFTVDSGSMPGSPSISAVLKYGSTTIATSSAASSAGGKLTFTFPSLGSPVTVPSGSSLNMVVTNNQSGVTFHLNYDSTTSPSFVSFDTSTVIHINSIGVYDAAYSGGSLITSGNNGDTLYVRTVVTDPFGAYDVNGINPLTIDGPGATNDVSTTLGAGNVVNTATCTKTYEYAWATGGTQGTYSIAATAKEGTENAVSDSKSTSFNLNFRDLGTPCAENFTTGSNGVTTSVYAANEQVCLRVSDMNRNTDAATTQSVGITLSSSAGDSEAMTLSETAVNTGIFVACIPSSSSVVGSNNNGTIYAPAGTVFSGSYTDTTDAADICTSSAAIPAPAPAMTVSKVLVSPADGQIVVGEAAQFRVRVTNTGNTTLATITLADTFPAANLTYVSASPAPTSSGSGTLSWSNVGPLLSGQSVDILVNFTGLASTAAATNSATADAGGGVTGTAVANVAVTNPAVVVTKTLVSPSPGPADKGTSVVFSISVQNTGDTVINTLPLEDTYSGACFTYVSSTPAADGTGYGSLVWTDVTGAGSLAPSAMTTISVTLLAAGDCNPASNTAAAGFVSDANGDPVPPSSSSATIVTRAASISGFVYEDQGAAGFGGDIALQNVTVTLFTDPNGDGNPSDGTIVQIATTFANGSYEFSNLPVGNYVVVETDALGYTSIADTQGSGADNRIAVAATTPTPFTGNNFLDDIIDPGTYSNISGQVRSDVDADGNLADADSGINGVTIDLYTDPNGDGNPADGVLFLTTTTAGGGLYSFTSIPPGNYVVVETDPSGYYSTADSSGANDNTIPVAAPASGTSSGNVFLDTNVEAADLAVTKVGPASVTPGTSVVYTITVTNNGLRSADAVSVADPTPSGLSFTSNTGDCTTVYPCSLGTLAVGATRTITSTYSVPASYTTPAPLLNTATVSSTTLDPVAGNNTSTSSTPVTPNADVAVTKVGPASVVPGVNAVYTITVTNNGVSDAAAVSVADTAPTGLTFVSNAGNCVTAYPCALGTVPAGATRTITSTYSVPSSYTTPNPVLNTATVSSTTTDPTPGNNSSTSSTPVTPSADLSITNDDGTAVYVAGGSLTYTVTVSNSGPSNVVGASVSDVFPPELQNIAWTCSGSGGGTCSASGSGGLSDLVNIPVGGSVTYLVSVDVIAGATVNPLTTTATVTAPVGTTDPTPGNNTASDSDTPAPAPASIGDRLWLDEDGDGVQDAGEDGLAGVTVRLYDATGTILITSTTTDLDGRYVFSGLSAASFVVRVNAATLPAGLAANPTYDLDNGTTSPDGETAITVAAGVFDDTADFGFNWVPVADSSTPGLGATGAIGDRIWNDANGNGVQDAGEAGIEGVTVRLLTDDDGDGSYGGAGDNAALTATTDASGHYIFDGVAQAAYEVQVDTTTLPAGFSTTPTGDPDSDGNNTSLPVVLAPGDVWMEGDFGYQLPGAFSIGHSIYLDANADGSHDVGEPGIAGVTVSLLNGGGQVIASTTTASDGSFLFGGLSDGTYSVVVTDAARVLGATPTNTGDPDGGFDRLSTVVLSGADDLTQDFGFAPAGHDTGDGLIGDTIFLDRNGDSLFDAGEGLAGVTVGLYNAAGTTLIATAVTDKNGGYVFGGLNPTATYVVRVDTATLPGAGAGLVNTVDPDGAVASEASVNLTTFVGAVTLAQDFAYAASTPNLIGGSIWSDANGNGTRSAGETGGYAGVVVVLLDSGGNVIATTTTDAAGDYQFVGLPDGTYTVRVADTADLLGGLWKSNGPNPGVDGNSQVDGYAVTVSGGATDTTADFGFYGDAGTSIGNRVFVDANDNGLQDPAEAGLAGVPVVLQITYASGDVSTIVTVTDGLGAYSFGNLMLDETFSGASAVQPTYSLSVATPANYQPSPVGVGADPQVDSNDPAGTTANPAKGVSNSTNETLPSNGYDFGFTPLTDLAVTVAAPAQLVPGTNASFTITVTNNGPSTALSSSVTATTPPGLSFVSNAGDCVSAFPCLLGDLPAGATRTITVTYSVPSGYTTPDPVVVSATVSTSTVDTNAANDSSSASVAVTRSADVSIVKLAPGAVTPGTALVYTILVTNNGPSDAAGVSVSDPTPSGLTFVSNAGACVGAFPCSLGSVLSGATLTITTTYSVPLSYTTPDPIVNTATVSSTTTDPTPANNSSTASTNLSAIQADLAVVKTGPASATPGSTVVYTVVVTNNGPASATLTMVTDPAPAGLTFVSNAGDCTTTYPCSLGTVANGGTRTITSTYSVPASYTSPNPIGNTAVVSSAAADPTPANNTSTASTPLSAQADLSVTKSGPATIVPGSNAIYTITVTNAGPSDATGVSVADPTPSGLAFVSNSGNCATAYPCSLGTIAAGATRTITTTYSVSSPYTGSDPAANTATVTSTTTDPTPANNSSTASSALRGVISGVVFDDADSDGAQTGSEAGLGGVTVTLTGPSCPAGCTTTTAADGSYSFTGLTFGAYTVVETDPSGYTSTTSNTVPVSVSLTALSVNFGDLSGGGAGTGADLRLIKSHSGTFTTCADGLYLLSVTNLGPDPSSGLITVTDTLPAALTYASATGSGWSCSASGQVVTCQTSGAIASGGASSPITLTVHIGASAFPTVNNTASVSSLNDTNPVNNAGSDSATVRTGQCPVAEDCPVNLQKVHSGNVNPGGEIQYTLEWSNACRNPLSDVTVSDTLPAGLTLLSASTSADATASIAGNTATFHIPLFAAHGSGKAFVTARIDPQATPGTAIVNVATLDDGAGHTASASNLLRVRGGSTSGSQLTCFVRAQVYARPGRFVKYDVRYKNGSQDNELTLTLPDQVQILRIYPAPDSQDGQTLYWGSLAQTAGKVTINTLVSPAAQDQSVLTGSATMDDRAGEVAVCEHVGVVSRSEKLFASLKAQTHARPGLPVRYIARYREALGGNQLTVSLPNEVTIAGVMPPPSGGTDRTLIWRDLPVPSGVVKIDAIVGAGVADGTVLVGSLTMTDDSTDVVSAETQTVVGSQTTSDSGGGELALTLNALRSVTAGSTTDVSVRYRNLSSPGSVSLVLPPEMTPVSATPSAAFDANTVQWTGLTSSSGSLKLRVAVDAGATSGQPLVIDASASDASAATATAHATTVVRGGSTSSSVLTMALTLASTVTKGLTTDIYAAYDGLQGSGQVTISLPAGLTLSSSVPAGATVVGSDVTWSGLSASSGSLRARVLVSGALASGTELPVSATIRNSAGETAGSAGSTTVR